jgi:hypothetical protein
MNNVQEVNNSINVRTTVTSFQILFTEDIDYNLKTIGQDDVLPSSIIKHV